MKKILLTLAVALMAVTTINAQSHGWFWFGPKAGMTTSKTDISGIKDADGAVSTFEGAQSYSAGIMTRFNLPLSIFSLHLQPELMYGWTKGSLKNENGENVAVKDFTVNNFDIPVLAGFGMDLGLFNARIQAGPVIKFNSSETLENTGSVDWKDVTYTWAAGVGIDLFNFIMIDARMIGGWKEGMEPTNFGEIFNFDNVNKDTNTIVLSLGVMF